MASTWPELHSGTNFNYVWDTGTLQWVKETQAGGGGGGGAVTIADGADVAEGTTTDVAWVAGAGTVISLLKKIASAGGGAVSIADGSDVAEGATTDAAVITDTTGTVSGKLRGLVKWAFERMPASLGQKLMAASFPVVLASDQAAIPVTATATLVDATATGTISGVGQSVTVATPGDSQVFLRITGAFSGQIDFESQMPDGTWKSTGLQQYYGETNAGNVAFSLTSANVAGWTGNALGTSFRATCSSYTSGTPVLNIIVKPGSKTFGAMLIGTAEGGGLSYPAAVDVNNRLRVTTINGSNAMPTLQIGSDGASRNGGTSQDPVVSAMPWLFNGATYDRARGDATNGAFVNAKKANVDSIGGAALTEGQKTMAASIPVVIASDQGAIPITGSISATSAATATALPPLNTEGVSSALSQDLAGNLRTKLPMEQVDPQIWLLEQMLGELRAMRLNLASVSGEHINPDQLFGLDITH
jgi:hypothetical protein